MGNVFILGAQSTGKTTIVNAIEEIFARPDGRIAAVSHGRKPRIIREVARNVLKTYNFTRHDITDSPARAFQLQKHILKAQFEAEQSTEDQAPDAWYITDRSGIDPIVYATIFVGEAAEQELFASSEWQALEQGMKQGMVFLCEAGTRWLFDDGTRLMPANEEKWMEVDQTFRRLLQARGIEYRVIPRELSDIAERVNMVTAAICLFRGTETSRATSEMEEACGRRGGGGRGGEKEGESKDSGTELNRGGRLN